ncbi:hypothetical protein CHCC20335_0516 [Bacillus paralicheniformis]|nr:hypothetical protein CHCC20335_0516 [Bacillus paralicheniformis]
MIHKSLTISLHQIKIFYAGFRQRGEKRRILKQNLEFHLLFTTLNVY